MTPDPTSVKDGSEPRSLWSRRSRAVRAALRHTFGTHLSAAGVRPRTAMAAMRHSRIDTTMNCTTDPVLLDVAGAMNSLPDFARGQSDTM